MGRNEIKLRRTNMSEGHIARHRNYGLLMKRHHRDLRVRRLTIVLIYVLLLIAVTVVFIIVKKEEQHRKLPSPSRPATALRIDPIGSVPVGA
jgi:hypothetical protein